MAANYNMDRRTNYGISWHERRLIDRLEAKLKTATSAQKRHRYVQRILKAKARLLAHTLANS